MAIEDYQALDREALLDRLRSLDTDLADLRTSYELVMEHNSLLENELYSRNASLQLGLIEQSNELQATRALNQKAHQHLLMTEKLAKLGELVAGMTHELNTPMGVAFTAASFQQTCTDRLGRVLAENKGKPLDNDLMTILRDDLEGLSETSAMLQTNLRRATEIVSSFKQMASDQVSDRARDFSLVEIIQQTLLSLRPRLRNTPFKVEIDCSPQLRIFSYPGTISQIVANLVVNSVVHGFEGRDQGLILITARLGEGTDTGTVLITHQDNGHGIPTNVLPRIFDQFFTTKEGEGGTGLGLHIVKSLVTERLGGTISCHSLAAKGEETGTTVFEIRLPVEPLARGSVDFNSPKP